MATTDLIRGMGTFVKECEHPVSRWSKWPHVERNGVGEAPLGAGVRVFLAHDQPLSLRPALEHVTGEGTARHASSPEEYSH
jgi:hypothetical protein